MAQLVYLKDVVTLEFEPEKCSGCGTCLEVCPRAVFARSNGRVSVRDRDACMECGACVRNCPSEALKVRTGVGCAAAVINSVLGRNNSSCCCVIEPEAPEASKSEAGPGCGCC
jgi:ferredoxin